MPRVSVGMAIRNEAPFLEQAIGSLLAQDFADFELIIADNDSEDSTGEICRRYAAREPRIRYLRHPKNVGAIKNFMTVFQESRGKYFMWAAGHDLWEPSMLSRCVEALERAPSAVLAFPRCALVDLGGRVVEELPPYPDTFYFEPIQRLMVFLWCVHWAYPIYGLFRADALGTALPLPATHGPDIVLLAKMTLRGPFAQVDAPLLKMRLTHPGETPRETWRRYLDIFQPKYRWGGLEITHWVRMGVLIRIALASNYRWGTKCGLVFSVIGCSLSRWGRAMAREPLSLEGAMGSFLLGRRRLPGGQ